MKTKLIFILAISFLFSVNLYADTEGFEGGEIPSNWTVIDNDGDGQQWHAANVDTLAHSGSYVARVWCNSSGCDDWLITPCLCPTSEIPYARLWYRSYHSSYPETFNVLVAPADITGELPPLEDFTIVQTHYDVPAQ